MSDSAFERFWDLGFKRLIPITPHDCQISERSTLHKRIGTKQDGRGKTPGTRGHDGLWSSFDWAAYEADETDLPRWAAMGAGVGIKTGFTDQSLLDGAENTGHSLIAIDADTLNQDFAVIIRDAIDARFGRLPIRVGQSPKALYILLINGRLPYSRIEFGTERVEVLTDGRQFVAEGIHPKTGKPYTWPRGIVSIADLPIVEPAEVTALLEGLRAQLPASSKVITEGAGSDVPQASLTGPLHAVAAAVRATPNSSNMFPSRESYVQYGLAIKAALPDHPAEALELFHDWCDRWSDGTNEHDVVEADWRRMKPPFRRGANWLYEQAEAYGQFDRASVWFEPLPPASTEIELNLFQADDANQPAVEVYDLLTLDEIMSRPPPVFLIDRHIPEVSVGFLYSVPGAGKSFLALDMSLHLATGAATWHGDAINTDEEAVVIYIAAEGSFGLRNRVKAWMQAHESKKLAKRFLLIEQTIDFMRAEDIDKLLRTVRGAGCRPCLVVVDTVSRAMPGADENLQKEMTLFVRACDKVRDAFRCAVLGVHHAGKNGDMRGSTVLLGAGDFVFKLQREQGRTIGRLHCEKQKDAADGWEESYSFDSVSLGDGESSLVVTRADLSVGPSIELTPSISAAVLEAMRAAWDSGEPWSKAAQSKERYYARRMTADFGFKASEAEELVRVWEGSGIVRTETRDAKRRKVGFQVVGSIGQDVLSDGVFD